MNEKNTEKVVTSKVRKQLKTAKAMINRFEKKRRKNIQELKRSVRELQNVKERNQAVEEK